MRVLKSYFYLKKISLGKTPRTAKTKLTGSLNCRLIFLTSSMVSFSLPIISSGFICPIPNIEENSNKKIIFC